MAKIIVLDDWQGVAESLADWSAVRAHAELVFLKGVPASPDALVKAIKDADAIATMQERTILSKAVLERLPKLKLISITSLAPMPNIDVAACAARGIAISHTVPQGRHSPAATAELAMGLMLAAQRSIPAADASIRSGGFQAPVAPGQTLEGATLGIVGLGKLGRQVAKYAAAFGMDIIAWSQNLTDEAAQAAGARRVSKDELMTAADIITLHLKLSDRSRGVVGAADIARMKPGALLVNTSRGPLVDEAALVQALNEGRIRAALDVFDEEPLPAGHPLRSAPGTVLTPHLGYVTQATLRNFYRQTAENLAAFAAGAPIRLFAPAA